MSERPECVKISKHERKRRSDTLSRKRTTTVNDRPDPTRTEFFYKNAATILDSTTDGVFTVDEYWKITSFNRAAEEITGVSREEAIGKTCQ